MMMPTYEAAGPLRAHAWPALVQQCGWAKIKGSVLTVTAEGKELMQQFDPATPCPVEADPECRNGRTNRERG